MFRLILNVFVDYFRYAFLRPKAFSGLVVFDVLPSKDSPETLGKSGP